MQEYDTDSAGISSSSFLHEQRLLSLRAVEQKSYALMCSAVLGPLVRHQNLHSFQEQACCPDLCLATW